MEKQSSSTTVSGVPVNALYTDADLDGFDPDRELGQPGQFPYTRGIHESMYRDRLWTMRQFAGFGRPADTNRRFRFLLEQGQTGLSTAFDLPTLMGLDSDDPRSAGEVGRLGVAVDTIDDMLALFDQIDLDRVSVSMTINAPAIVVMAFYLAAARDSGIRLARSARHDSERHPQGVSRAERGRVSAGALGAAGGRPDRVLHAARAEVEHRFDQRLPHSRGRLDGGSGAGLHAGRRPALRRTVPRTRHGHRRVRAAAELLLQRAQRLVRGSRQVPRRPFAVGGSDARSSTGRSPTRRGSCGFTPKRPAARCRPSSRR